MVLKGISFVSECFIHLSLLVNPFFDSIQNHLNGKIRQNDKSNSICILLVILYDFYFLEVFAIYIFSTTFIDRIYNQN